MQFDDVDAVVSKVMKACLHSYVCTVIIGLR